MKLVRESLFEFEQGLDPKHALGIGLASKIKKWFDELKEESYRNEDYKYRINKDGTIDMLEEFQLPWGTKHIPDYIKFNKIDGDFKITDAQGITNFDFFPNYIAGDLEFYGNGIRMTNKRLRDLGTEVDGQAEFANWKSQEDRMYKAKYNKRGPVKDRPTQHFGGGEYSMGYKLYKALKYIESTGADGARYTDIISTIYQLTYPGAGPKPFSSGWGVGYFSPKYRSPIGTKADKNEAGRWVLNGSGRQYLEKHKDNFDVDY